MQGDDQPNLSANRDQLSVRLQEVAPPLAEVYRGALQVLAQPQMPGRAYFLAHAAREIANGLPEWITGAVSRKESKQLNRLTEAWEEHFPYAPYREESHRTAARTADIPIPRQLFEQTTEFFGTRHDRAASRDAFQRLLQWLGPGNRYLLGDLSRLEKEWMDLRSWFEATNKVPRSHGARAPDEQKATEHFERFEWWLGALLQGFFAGRRELEQILEDATPERLPQLLPLLAPDQQRWLFFERLAEKADPSWLGPLEDAGFFSHPPGRVRREEDPNVIVIPRWPASFYLAKMALNPDAQKAVLRIALKIVSNREIDNWLVQSDLADVALRLPLSAAAKLSRRMLSWGAGPQGSNTVAGRLAELAVRLARGGHTKEALKLMRALLAFKAPAPLDPESLPGEPRPRIGNWALKNIIEKSLPDFVDAVGLAGLDLACSTLKRALESGRRKGDGAVDHSYVWLPCVESVDLHGSEQLREMLAAAVARLAFRLLETGTPLTAVIEALGNQQSGVSRRLTQYLLSQHIADAPDVVRSHVLRREDFESFRREYRMLLAAGFSQLPLPDKSTVLGWIETGPDLVSVRRGLAFLKGGEPTAEEMEHWRRRWQWERLRPLTPHLSTDWLDRQRELNKEFGPPGLPSDPDFRPSFGAIGSPAPLQLADIRTMSVSDIVDRIKAWRPPSTQVPMLPDDGAVLAEGVGEEPGRFAVDATSFLDLGPTYARAILDGLWRAARDRKVFDWGPVLDFASLVLRQEPLSVPGANPWDEERGWEWSRGAVARLLKAGLSRHETAPPSLLRDRIWPLIETLADDPIGTRVEAVGAAMEYAKWLATDDGELFQRVPEVGRFLEKQLAEEQLRAPEVHAEFGSYLALLAWHSPKWTHSNLKLILPNVLELSEAVIRAFVRGPVPPTRALVILGEVYSRAVEQLMEDSPVLPGVLSEAGYARERLADHLIILYGRGALDEIGATALLDSFLSRASAALRRYAVFAVGRSLGGANDGDETGAHVEVPSEVLERFARLWGKRMALLATDPQLIHELPGFGSWFSSGRFDSTWALDQLEQVLGKLTSTRSEPVLDQPGIVRRLASLADQEPVRAARVLRQLAELTDDGGTAYGWIDHAPTIVGAAIRSGDVEARRAVIGLLDRLGALGFRDVRQFVPASDDLDDPMAIPYFVWDQPLTVAQLRERLASASEPESDRLLGMVLRQANDMDVWKFTTPQEVLARWDRIEKHLGRRRAFWSLLLKKWQEEGLLAH